MLRDQHPLKERGWLAWDAAIKVICLKAILILSFHVTPEIHNNHSPGRGAFWYYNWKL
jgi:hypothetical protein